MAGTIYEASGSFYVRYVTGLTTLSKNGKPRPVQKSHKLCDRNDKYYSSKAKAVKLLRDEFMLTLASRSGHSVAEDMRIRTFWETRYLPYCNDTLQLTGRPRKKLCFQSMNFGFGNDLVYVRQLGNGIARQQSEAQYRYCGPTDNLTLILCILPNSLAQPST